MYDTDDLDEPKAGAPVGGLLRFILGASEVGLWAIPIIFAIAGGVFGNYVDDDYIFYGIIIGVVTGILVDIIYGGVIAALIVIEKNTAKTEENTAEILAFLKKGANVAGSKVATANADVADFESDADAYGRRNYRTWYDSDGGKHESWVDADGNKHET